MTADELDELLRTEPYRDRRSGQVVVRTDVNPVRFCAGCDGPIPTGGEAWVNGKPVHTSRSCRDAAHATEEQSAPELSGFFFPEERSRRRR